MKRIAGVGMSSEAVGSAGAVSMRVVAAHEDDGLGPLGRCGALFSHRNSFASHGNEDAGKESSSKLHLRKHASGASGMYIPHTPFDTTSLKYYRPLPSVLLLCIPLTSALFAFVCVYV